MTRLASSTIVAPITRACTHHQPRRHGHQIHLLVEHQSLTMKCLNSEKVRHLDETDPNFSEHHRIQTADHTATALLTGKGYDGEKLEVVFHESAFENETVCLPFTQEMVVGVANAETQGALLELGPHAVAGQRVR